MSTVKLPEEIDSSAEETQIDTSIKFHEEVIDNTTFTNLIINYLPSDFNEESIQRLFERFGTIVEKKVVRDRVKKRSLGYGFVRFATEAEAENAIMGANGSKVGDKLIKVSFARPPSQDIMHCKLFATNFPTHYTEIDCQRLFSQYGKIIELRLVNKTADPQSKATMFIQYDLKSQAENALNSLHDSLIDGSQRLIVRFTNTIKDSSFRKSTLPERKVNKAASLGSIGSHTGSLSKGHQKTKSASPTNATGAKAPRSFDFNQTMRSRATTYESVMHPLSPPPTTSYMPVYYSMATPVQYQQSYAPVSYMYASPQQQHQSGAYPHQQHPSEYRHTQQYDHDTPYNETNVPKSSPR